MVKMVVRTSLGWGCGWYKEVEGESGRVGGKRTGAGQKSGLFVWLRGAEEDPTKTWRRRERRLGHSLSNKIPASQDRPPSPPASDWAGVQQRDWPLVLDPWSGPIARAAGFGGVRLLNGTVAGGLWTWTWTWTGAPVVQEEQEARTASRHDLVLSGWILKLSGCSSGTWTMPAQVLRVTVRADALYMQQLEPKPRASKTYSSTEVDKAKSPAGALSSAPQRRNWSPLSIKACAGRYQQLRGLLRGKELGSCPDASNRSAPRTVYFAASCRRLLHSVKAIHCAAERNRLHPLTSPGSFHPHPSELDPIKHQHINQSDTYTVFVPVPCAQRDSAETSRHSPALGPRICPPGLN
ncbi:hypothetical protein M440DRAFT_345640 [Trichoderma longibrachiatum ATCC 18648]|uniref:Uncharacterized protein n=1 Tax=Trichoderma longibrachiatum ATCC 18648 TaxID=983965 RepID=A0A2T4BY58_TRILO|nr:hypothetical protein M440DRAFT_345640 [Trichoderma longibrachiatum ATCC 18648]